MHRLGTSDDGSIHTVGTEPERERKREQEKKMWLLVILLLLASIKHIQRNPC